MAIRVSVKDKLHNERGASAVEFALILPLLLLLVFGIIQFGIIFNHYISITHAAREGVRWASLREEESVVKTKAVDAAPGLGLEEDDVTVNNAWPGGTQGEPVSVTVTHTVTVIMPFLDVILGPSVELNSTATQRME